MNIAIIPDQEEFLNNKIFDCSKERDNILERYYLLKISLEKKGHHIETIDKYDYASIDIIIFMNLNSAIKTIIKCIKKNPYIIIINYAAEPLLVDILTKKEILESDLFDFVLTWNDDLIDTVRYIEMRNFSYNKRTHELVQFKEKKYLCIINVFKKSTKNGELYSERENAIKYFSRNNKIDLYGIGWDKHPDNFIKKLHKGTVVSKLETMINYKFSIAYENCNNEKGYISEKIFDSFSSNCIPIFYGPDNVQQHIPPDTFIDFRNFANYKELEAFLDNVDEKSYNQYLDNIKIFMDSDIYVKYTSQGFADTIISLIENINAPLRKKNVYKIKLYFIKTLICDIKLLWKLKRFIIKIIMS